MGTAGGGPEEILGTTWRGDGAEVPSSRLHGAHPRRSHWEEPLPMSAVSHRPQWMSVLCRLFSFPTSSLLTIFCFCLHMMPFHGGPVGL